QEVCRLGGFDSLPHSTQAARTNELQDCREEGGLRGVAAERREECSVHLDGVHGQAAEVVNGGVAGAEIVDLHLDAEPPEAVQRVAVKVVALNDCAFGQLQNQQRGVQPGRGQGFAYVLHELQPLEVCGGHVDAHMAVVAPRQGVAAPPLQLLDGGAQHPTV